MRSWRLPAALTVIAALLAGCGGDSDPEPEAQTHPLETGAVIYDLEAMIDRLVEERTGRVVASRVMHAIDGSGDLTTEVRGTYDLKKSAFDGELRVIAGNPVIAAELERNDIESGEVQMRIRRADNALYMSSPRWTGEREGKWLHYDAATLGPTADAAGLTVDFSAPPIPLLGAIGGATDGRLSRNGDEFIVDVPADAILSEFSTDAVRTLFEAGIDTQVSGTLPARVAVDDERITITVDATPAIRKVTNRGTGDAVAFGNAFEFEYVVELFALGTAVDVPLPALTDLIDDPDAPAPNEAAVLPNDLTAGMCLMSSEQGDLGEFEQAECGTRHGGEVYAVVDIEDPGAVDLDVLDRASAAACINAFEAFVGVPYSESELEVFYLAPTVSDWRIGRRVAPCIIASEPRIGSLQGFAK